MLLYMRIYQHLVDNNIFIDKQYGFRISSSAVKATHLLLNITLNALNNKQNSCLYMYSSLTNKCTFINLKTH